jgi:tetratricopeptide (TPR) repeat protein
MRIIKVAVTLVAGVALVSASQIVARANGVSVPPPSSSSAGSPATPDSMAIDAYNSGMSHRDRAVKADNQVLKDKNDADRAKSQTKSRDEYQKALSDFQRAVDLNPRMPQAYNGLGYAYRKLGDYARALENYDRALRLNPKFVDAIEYRGEAYLGLNQLDDAKQAYMALFAMNRKQADLLMNAMNDYVAKKKVDPGGVDPTTLSEFEAWIRERATVAEQTKQMAINVRQPSWR